MWPHGRNRKQTVALATIWEVPDDLWTVIAAAIADLDPPRRGGRPRIDQGAAFTAIIYRLRTGCQWTRLPKDFPNDRSVHRTVQRWLARGVLERVWAQVAAAAGIVWDQQVVDATLGTARLGGSHWPEPDRPRQTGRDAEHPGGPRWWAAGSHRRCGHYARLPPAGPDPGCHRTAPSTSASRHVTGTGW